METCLKYLVLYIIAIKKYCNPKDFVGSKKNKRDFHNWENGTRQLLNLLSTTAYFEFDNIKRRLFLGKTNHKKDKNIGEISKLIRSNLEKKNYFEKRNISKKPGFELHHIKPLFWVKTVEELKLTDNWKNML